MTSEMVERLATAFNSGSFANEYAKRWTVRNLVKMLEAMTCDDLRALLAEKVADEESLQKFKTDLSVAYRADVIGPPPY